MLVKPLKEEIKLPVVKASQASYPNKPLCPWCRKRKVHEPHSMLVLSGGALSRDGDGAYSGPTKGLRGFLSLCWHGAHDDGEGDGRETDLVVDIAREVEGGVFDIMFCSVDCLRAFLNDCLDKFEKQVDKLEPTK